MREARALGLQVIDRCNLTVLLEPGQGDLVDFLAAHQVWYERGYIFKHFQRIAHTPCATQAHHEHPGLLGSRDSKHAWLHNALSMTQSLYKVWK